MLVRHYRLRVDERDAFRSRDLARSWTKAFASIEEPELRLQAILALAGPLARVQRAIVFREDGVVAAQPGARAGAAVRRLFERARSVLEDEFVSPDLYVARISPNRPERLALHWHAPGENEVEIARAIVASCGWAFEVQRGIEAPADLPDVMATFRRLEQLIHDSMRMQRAFAVVYLDVEPPENPVGDGARDALARELRREVRANDHLGHLGGDAFLALISLGAGEWEAYPAAQRLLHAAGSVVPDAPANVGVAVCPNDGVRPEDLIEKASAAAMAAASVGGGQPYWYREATGRTLRERATMRRLLREGGAAELIDVRFQPIVDLRSGAALAVGATACWKPGVGGSQSPEAQLDEDGDRASREALDLFTIGAAAAAQRAWRAAGIDLRVHLAVGGVADATVDAVAAGFGTDDALQHVWVELEAGAFESGGAETFVRRLRTLGAVIGLGYRTRTAAPAPPSIGPLDFVTVDGDGELGTLAALAFASILAPVVIARAVPDWDRGRWLVRHGATAVRGDGLLAPLGLQQLVRWASEWTGSLVL